MAVPDPSGTAGGTHRLELPHPSGDVEPTIARLWAAGALGVWERPDQLVAWFAERPELPPELAGDARWSFEPDRDWQGEWKATIRPVRAGRTVVVPSWLAERHPPGPDAYTIVLDPGRAFGSGHHATTTMCLELLDEVLPDGDGTLHTRVADIGCGTGVLAIAAAQRGAETVAVDIDADAVDVARANAASNGVELDLRVGSIEALDEPVDVVVANLVTDVIVSLASELIAACRQTLIVSGIATARGDLVTSTLEGAGATVIETRERDGWVALRARTDD